MQFFHRFAEISQRMPDRLRLAKLRDSDLVPTGPISREEQTHIVRSMIEYGNLCSEEFYLHSSGKIPAGIWESWKGSIRQNFESTAWRDAWQLVAVEYESFPQFSEFMAQIMVAGEKLERAKVGESSPPARPVKISS